MLYAVELDQYALRCNLSLFTCIWPIHSVDITEYLNDKQWGYVMQLDLDAKQFTAQKNELISNSVVP